MNPNQRLTSLKWRKEVLTRIHRLLYLLLEKKKSKDNSTNCVSNSEINRCPLYNKRDFNVKFNFQKPGHTATEMVTSNNKLQDFVSHLFPLLIETWVEAMAGEQLSKASGIVTIPFLIPISRLILFFPSVIHQGGSLIGAESAELLVCMTNIIFTVWNILNQSENRTEVLNWFQTEYGDLLIRNFIQRFPFSARVEPKKKNMKIDSQCREQNLILCFIWTQINLKSSPKFAKSIFNYLSGKLNNNNQFNISIFI